jgi:hypothetical protein
MILNVYMAQVMAHGGTTHADLMTGMNEAQMAEFGKNLEAAIQPDSLIYPINTKTLRTKSSERF